MGRLAFSNCRFTLPTEKTYRPPPSLRSIESWIPTWLSGVGQTMDRESNPIGFLHAAVGDLLANQAVAAGGLVRQRSGRWELDFWQSIPDADLVKPNETAIADAAEQFDGRTSRQIGNVYLVPVHPPATDRTTDESIAKSIDDLSATHQTPAFFWFTLCPGERILGDDAAMALSLLVAVFQRFEIHARLSRRNQSLVKLLNAAAKWQTIDDLDELLSAVAATSTEILDCQRASIFLHDKRRGVLIGRPAIGIADGALTVPDDRGIVGEVLASGEGRLWTRGDDVVGRQNAEVDAQTEFETRSLAAVPMMNWQINNNATTTNQYAPTDQCIGVFEAINHHDGPFTPEDLVTLADLAIHASAAIASQSRRERLIRSRDRLINDAKTKSELIGQHSSVEHLRSQVARLAPTDLSVLIRGENGTGKEILARQVHYQSGRHDGPFIAVNCAAIVETLLESELFGHEKGAFTDASQTRIGKFEAAAGGTLFLDEIGDMTAGGQAKLLRALESREIVRVGGTETIPVDVRIIAATNQPLESLISAKKFREDLFFRLAVVSLTLPPLRERGQDVVLLAEHFLHVYAPGAGRQQIELSQAAKNSLCSFPWPGNIRQLRNVIERTCYLAEGNVIEPSDLDLPATTDDLGNSSSRDAVELSQATKQFQVLHINRTIARCGGNMTQAATALGLHRSNLYRKMRQLEMPSSREEEDPNDTLGDP